MEHRLVESMVAGPAGPTAPRASARTRLTPLALGAARITGGLWADRQRVNREVTIPAAHRKLVQSGNLDNFRRAAGNDRGGFRGRLFADSEVYKWLEALAWEQGREPSAELASWQTEATALIAAAQHADGYLNTYFQISPDGAERYADLTLGHELFCTGHMLQAAVAQRRATGVGSLLDVAVRAGDHLVATFGPDRLHGVCGHPEIETALVELYRETGNEDYLRLAAYFVDARGHGLLGPSMFGPSYHQDRVPVREAHTIEGHAVRALFLAAGVTDVYVETGDAALFDAMRAQWDDMVSGKSYLTGGVGARWEGESFGDRYELPPDRAYCETCAAHASILWSWRMLLITGEARYADLIERTLYNAFSSGLSLSGDRFFYTNPLQLRSDARDTSSRSVRHGRQPWLGTPCCPPNIMRMLASLDHYLATQTDEGVQIHQYADGKLGIGGAEVVLRIATDYPWREEIDIEVEAAPDQPYTIALRIPGWCTAAEVGVNAGAPGAAPDPGSYLELRRRWAAGDRIQLRLPMPARRTYADERVDAVRDCVAVERGPLVYCVEQADHDVDVELIRDAGGALRATHRADLLGGVTVVDGPAVVVDEQPAGVGPPYRSGDPLRPAGRPARFTAIPYYAWANRDIGPMRVWIPRADHGS
ncbi:MAG TPA: beta-L-arabinofuranosidase domain-containing protein [Jatrophihabitans sp.]|jgi:DUF1680 family protein|nr:beta-L-arabinofuranosidase domain-containing protein [Jatrophihabitans sp.]